MKKKILLTAALSLVLACCGGNKKTPETNTDTKDTTKTEQTSTTGNGKIDPFKDFPKESLTSNPGDFVLSPSKNWQEDATSKGADQVTFIFYDQKMAEAGNEYSKIDFMSDKGIEIPNYMIIPIKPGQTAKKGDILLTWWQSGSGMQRAIVVDDKNPSEPIVNYIDIDWNNPAKNDKGVGIGQQTEQLKPNTFHVISSDWEPGTTVAAKDGSDYSSVTVVKVSGDKVLAIGYSGIMKVYAKADCTPIAVKTNVKVGDMVQAPWVGKFKNMKVEKTDSKMGRIWVDDPYSDKPLIVPYGDVTTGLNIQ